MNPYKHAEISVRKRGGKIEDYYAIHNFMDATKELCSDNRHRILHNLWGVRRVIIPIFGTTIINSNGKEINVKDLCEQDHILPDYRNKFIPTLKDFVDAIKLKIEDLPPFEEIIKLYQNQPLISQLLLSPLSVTGEIKSLLLTHNSWFIYEILPIIFKDSPTLNQINISPAFIFDSMEFESWMDNGATFPRSAKQINNLYQHHLIKK